MSTDTTTSRESTVASMLELLRNSIMPYDGRALGEYFNKATMRSADDPRRYNNLSHGEKTIFDLAFAIYYEQVFALHRLADLDLVTRAACVDLIRRWALHGMAS